MYRNVFIGICFFILLCSVIWSGLWYQYDVDELSHVQYTYLILEGAVPYKDFFLRFTPWFYWIISPVLFLGGYSFDTISFLRGVMVVIYLLRLGIVFLLFRWLWDLRVACLASFFILIDPFSTFSGMQIRPDNLMMLVYFVSIYFLIHGQEKKQKMFFILSGMCMSFAILLLMKIVLVVGIVMGGVFSYWLVKKSWQYMFLFCLGGLMPFIVVLVWAVSAGVWYDMVQQSVTDSLLINGSILFPTFASYFYRPGNTMLFGPGYLPLTWWFVWVLLLGSLIGMVSVMRALPLFSGIHMPWKQYVSSLLVISFFVQMCWIFSFPGAFVHYFLSVSWLMCGFLAYMCVLFVAWVKKTRFPLLLMYTLACILFVSFSASSVYANMFRSQVTSDALVREYAEIWSVVPEKEKTFPNMLFRPISYPLNYGTFIGDMPKPVIKRFGLVMDYLKKDEIKYLFVSDFMMSFIDVPSRSYMMDMYEKTYNGRIWVKKRIQ